MPRLGVDIGGVIRLHTEGDGRILAPDAIEVIRYLSLNYFDREIYIFSNRPASSWTATAEWLVKSGFLAGTGMPMQHVYFATSREQKAEYTRKFQITHFVDDRIPVLKLMPHIPHRFLYRPPQIDLEQYKGYLVPIEQDWKLLGQRIAATITTH